MGDEDVWVGAGGAHDASYFAGHGPSDQRPVSDHLIVRADQFRGGRSILRVTSWPRPSVIDGQTVETPPLFAPATINQMSSGPPEWWMNASSGSRSKSEWSLP